jgi:hypothetical protein
MVKGELSEKGFFDVAPECDKAVFSGLLPCPSSPLSLLSLGLTSPPPSHPPAGTWSNYPYFASGTIAVQSIEKGLFLVKVAPPLPSL